MLLPLLLRRERRPQRPNQLLMKQRPLFTSAEVVTGAAPAVKVAAEVAEMRVCGGTLVFRK